MIADPIIANFLESNLSANFPDIGAEINITTPRTPIKIPVSTDVRIPAYPRYKVKTKIKPSLIKSPIIEE